MKKIFAAMSFLLVLLLAACGNKTNNPTPIVDVTKPRFIGIQDATVLVGSTFHPREGIRAEDDTDGDLTAEIVITGEVNTAIAARYTLVYTVEDKAKNKAEQSRVITVVENQGSDLFLVNGDFSQPLEGTWTHWAGEGGNSTATIENGEAVIDIKANGTQWFSTQFSQSGLTITQGKMYRIEFEARADLARGMIVKIEDTTYYGYIDEYVVLSTTMKQYSFEFFVTKPTITNGKLNICIGNMSSKGDGEGALTKVYLDNFVFSEVDPGTDDVPPIITGATPKTIAVNDAFDPLEGITVSDNRDINLTLADIEIEGEIDITTPGDYVLIYILKDAAGNETRIERTITVLSGLVPSTWLVVNGDFEEEQLAPLPQPAATGWGWHGAGKFSASIQNGVAEIVITDPGTVVHGVQFYQQNRVIQQGQIYCITFRARAEIARPIMIALEEGTTRRYDEIVFLTSEWQTFEIQIEYILTGFHNGKFAFFLGDVGDNSVPTTVYLDDVKVETVEKLTDKTAPQLFGLADYYVAQGSQFQPLQGVTIRDNIDKTLKLEDIDIDGTVNTNEIGTYILTYRIKDASGNENVYEREIKVVAKEEMLENMFTVVNGDFSEDQLIPTPQPATTGWGWHGAGQFTAAIQDGIAKIVITEIGTVPHGVQFYQQNRIIETGATYLLTFKAKAEIARNMRISLEAGTDVRFYNIVDIDTEWTTYEVLISPTGGGFTNGKLGFFIGKVDDTSVPTTVYLDDVTITLVGYKQDLEKPMILGAIDTTIEVGAEFNPKAGISVFDIVDKTLNLNSLVVEGAVDTAVAGSYTLIYRLKDKQGNEIVIERVIIVQ